MDGTGILPSSTFQSHNFFYVYFIVHSHDNRVKVDRESDFVFYGAVWTCKQAGLEPDIKEQKGSR